MAIEVNKFELWPNYLQYIYWSDSLPELIEHDTIFQQFPQFKLKSLMICVTRDRADSMTTVA